MKQLVVIIAVFIGSWVNAQDYGDSLVTYDFNSPETIEFHILKYINKERVKAGLPEFTIDTTLQRLAKIHSAWMCKTSIYVHSNDPRTPDPKQHRRLNYAENCMMYHSIMYLTHKTLAKVVVTAWMLSPAHSKNILNPEVNKIGIGFSQKINTEDQMEQYFTIMMY